MSIKSTRSGTSLRHVVVAMLTVILVGVMFTSTATAASAQQVKPSIVLVHGAWADSGSWDAVIHKLQSRGYTVYAPPNPLRGLQNDSGAIRDFIDTIPGPIVLVGHSYGGAVITNAALGDTQVKALVYVDGFLPAKGDTLASLTTAGSCFAVADPTTVFNFAPFPGAPAGVFDAYVKQSVFTHCFANGLPAAEANVLAATQRPLATNTFTDVSGTPAWKTIPSWAIVGTVDRVIPEPAQLMMAHRAHAHITTVRAPHLSMIKAPGVVARVIARAARATG